MAAPRVTRRVTGGLWAALIVIAPATAHAQTVISVVAGDVDEPFVGMVFRYSVRNQDVVQPADRIIVHLWDYLELLDVVTNNGTSLFPGGVALCAGGGPPPYTCPTVSCDLAEGCTWQPWQVTAQAAAGGAQDLRFETAWPGVGLETMELRVRLRGGVQCNDVTAETRRTDMTTATDTSATLTPFCDAPPVLVSVSVAPSTGVAPRGGGAVSFSLEGQVSVPGDAIVAVDPHDPTVLTEVLQCAQGGGAFGPCAGGPFASFATVALASAAPFSFSVQAVDQPRPPPGDLTVRVDLTALTKSANPGELLVPVTVEQPATSFSVAVARGGATLTPPYQARPGEQLLLTVEQAENALSGSEPPTGTWRVASAVYDDAQPPPDTTGWLSSGATALEPVGLALPAALLANGSPGLTLTLLPSHPNPTPPALEGAPVVITVAGEPVEVRRCRIEAQRPFVAEKSWTGLRLVTVDGGGATAPVSEAVVWEVTPATVGAVQSTPAAADGFVVHLVAADPLPAVAEVTIGATSIGCDEPPAPVTLTLQRLVTVRLTADRRAVAPGEPVRLKASFENLSGGALAGLRARLVLDPRLVTARQRPAGGAGVTVQALAEPLATAGVAPAATKGQREFSLDLAAAGGELEVQALVRAAAAPGPATVRLQLFSSAALSRPDVALAPLGEAAVRLQVERDPTAEEATLFGKVFVDRDGDGRQADGEPGVGGVMVAVAAGMYALTDGEGRYHLARLAPGRQAVKLNRATLPLGATVVGLEHREVTLTPGGWTRVNFGVRLPQLDRPPLSLVGGQSGVALDGERLVYRAVLAPLVGETLVARQAEREWRATIEGEAATLLLPLDEAGGVWTLVEQAADGRTWLASFALLVYPRAEAGPLLIPVGPRPLAGLVLPAAGQRVRAAELVIAGQASAAASLRLGTPGERDRCQVESNDAATRWRCVIPLTAAVDQLITSIDPAPEAGLDPPAQGLVFPLEAEPGDHFLVALGGVSAGAVLHGEGWTWDGGGSFFYRGRTAGGLLLTAGADAWAHDLLLTADGRRRSLGGIGAALLGHDPRRIFRDLDPEEYPLVFGDGSTTVDERESGGRFFLRVQEGESYLKWGGLNTALDDAEVGRFVRSLYGLGGVWQLGGADGPWQLGARGFAAQPESASARDELVATGGSLYFLSHRYVVEGSVRLTLETLDEISGLPIAAVPLVEGPDFEVDHAGGRLVLEQALAYRVFGRSLSGAGSGGHRQRLIVEYEYLPGLGGTRDWSLGGKLSGRVGPVSLSATAVTELAGLAEGVGSLRSRYALLAGAARLDLGAPLRLRVELARSDGQSHTGARSRDGGLSFVAARAGAASGEAAVVELTTGFGEAEAALYGRLTTAGFADSRSGPGQRLVQGGLRLGARLPSRTRLWGNYDHRESRWPGSATPALVVRDLGLVGVTQALGPLELSAEGRVESQPRQDESRALLGLEATLALSRDVALSARRRQRVAASGAARRAASGESAIGVRVADAGAWQLEAEAGLSDAAEPFARASGGFALDEETELYAGLAVGSHLAVDLAEPGSDGAQSLVAGGRRQLAGGVNLYSEQGLRLDGGERVLTRAVGGQVPLAKRITLSLGYERGTVDAEGGAAPVSARDAGSVAVSFAGERVTARLAADGWLDEAGGGRRAALGSQARLDFRATEALTLALAGRGASAFAGRRLGADRRAWEGALGFALRPVRHDRLNLFGRYALTYERVGAQPQQLAATLSHVSSLAAVWEVTAPLAVGPRVAYRHTLLADGAAEATDRALLGALRADVHLVDGWDVAAEGRVCTAPGSELETRVGALTELSLLVWEWLRLGAGYNFSAISAQGVRCVEPGARGLFLRAEAIY